MLVCARTAAITRNARAVMSMPTLPVRKTMSAHQTTVMSRLIRLSKVSILSTYLLVQCIMVRFRCASRRYSRYCTTCTVVAESIVHVMQPNVSMYSYVLSCQQSKKRCYSLIGYQETFIVQNQALIQRDRRIIWTRYHGNAIQTCAYRFLQEQTLFQPNDQWHLGYIRFLETILQRN